MPVTYRSSKKTGSTAEATIKPRGMPRFQGLTVASAAVRFFTAAGLLSLAALFAVIFGGLFYSASKIGFGAVFSAFAAEWAPTAEKYGIMPMITGTLLTALLATLYAIPLSFGIISCIWIYNNAFSRFLRTVVRFMSGIPTVNYAFGGLIILIPVIRHFGGGSGYNVLAVSVVLCLLILPTMTLTADSALHSFINSPENPMLAAASLGMKRDKSFLYIALYARGKWLFTGVLLAFSRALGDTLIALMLSGNSPVFPRGMFSSTRTLSGHINLLTATEITSHVEFILFLSGFLLFIAALSVNLVTRALRGK